MKDLEHDLDELRKTVVNLQKSHIKLQVKVYGEEPKQIYEEEDKKEICKPNLGCATTRELIAEIKARIEVDGKLEYRTVDGE